MGLFKVQSLFERPGTIPIWNQRTSTFNFLIQAHVKAVTPKLDSFEEKEKDLAERVKRIEKEIIKKHGKKGGVDLTEIVEEHDSKIGQLVAIVEHDILAKMLPMDKKVA